MALQDQDRGWVRVLHAKELEREKTHFIFNFDKIMGSGIVQSPSRMLVGQKIMIYFFSSVIAQTGVFIYATFSIIGTFFQVILFFLRSSHARFPCLSSVYLKSELSKLIIKTRKFICLSIRIFALKLTLSNFIYRNMLQILFLWKNLIVYAKSYSYIIECCPSIYPLRIHKPLN